MVYFIAVSAAAAAALMVFAIAQLIPARSAAVKARVDEVAGAGGGRRSWRWWAPTCSATRGPTGPFGKR